MPCRAWLSAVWALCLFNLDRSDTNEVTRRISSALRKCVWAQGWLRPLRRKIRLGYGNSARTVTSPGSDASNLAERGHLEAEQGGAEFSRQVAYRAAVVARQACEWADIDYCDVDGDVYIAYSWGNQQGTEFLGAARVAGTTTDEWLAAFF